MGNPVFLSCAEEINCFTKQQSFPKMISFLVSMTGSTLDGSLIEVCLAKPVDKNDYVRFTRGTAGRATLPGVRIPDGLLNADLKTGEVLVEVCITYQFLPCMLQPFRCGRLASAVVDSLVLS